jgi:hypothetical protein
MRLTNHCSVSSESFAEAGFVQPDDSQGYIKSVGIMELSGYNIRSKKAGTNVGDAVQNGLKLKFLHLGGKFGRFVLTRRR